MTVDPNSSRLWLVVPVAQILEPQPSVSLEGKGPKRTQTFSLVGHNFAC